MSSTTNFSSEGFDLDAMPQQQQDSCEDVIFEVGGGVTSLPKQPKEPKQPKRESAVEEIDPAIVASEQFKAQGNDQFKRGAYLEAYDMYTDAMESCPGMKGSEILKLRDEFDEQQQAKAYENFRQQDEERKQKLRQEQDEQRKEILKGGTTSSSSSTTNSSSTTPTTTSEEQQPKEQFKAPVHKYGDKLSVYHCNRAACLLHLQRYVEAIVDCDVAILLQPNYIKALSRRSTAYEQTERLDEALQDAKLALQFADPSNKNTIRKNVMRLQKLNDEHLEELKEKTMGQLKDLGNSLLGNFGMSLDNFKAVQDPNTGSYSISFEQNK